MDDENEEKWYEIWREQCAAAVGISEGFGKRSALEYIVGEKFLNHLKAAPSYPELAAETPKFTAEIKSLFMQREIAEFFNSTASSQKAKGAADDDYQFDEADSENIITEAENIILMDQAKELLLDE